MKKILFISIFIIISAITVFSQNNKNKFGVEIAPSFTGKFDCYGILFSGEYSRILLDNFNVGLNLELYDFTNSSHNTALSYKNIGLDFRYKINLGSSVNFFLGIGSFYRRTNFIYYYYSRLITDTHNEPFDIYDIMNEKYSGIGYSASFGFEIFPKENISFTTKLSFQNDINNDITWSLRPGLNFYF